MRIKLALTLAVLMASAAGLAGCFEEPSEAQVPEERAACGPTGSPAGYDQTGSVQEGEPGTPQGDIGSETSCAAQDEEGLETQEPLGVEEE